MVKSIFKTVIVASFFAAVLVVGYSCSDDGPYYPDDYMTEAQIRRMIEDALKENNKNLPFTNWEIVNITVKGGKNGDWRWNDNENRYEAIYELPEMDEFIYEDGAILGYVFIGEQNQNEVQKLLPFVQTYDEGGEIFTETISFDVQLKKGGIVKPSVAFYIQTSDLFGSKEFEEFLPNHNFRLVIVW
ncbi:MAG: hypothetical protein GXZ19_08820 [Bacteroidales bacterium]|nr:hypothetical protein [Bacteroidales bacterium]